MTELLTRTARTSAGDRRSSVDGVTRISHAGIAAAMAAGAGLVAIALVVLITWAATPGSNAGADAALQTVGQVWLLGHRASLEIAGAGNLALLPLGLLALPAYALWRAGEWLAHSTDVTDLRAAAAAGTTMGACYGVIGALVATGARGDTVHPVAPQALIATGIIGTLFGTAGVLRGAGLYREAWSKVPPRAASVLVAAAASVGCVLAFGVILAVGAVLLHPGQVLDVGRSVHPGPVGWLALGLACLGYLPNAAVWASAYAVGPGFAVGAHTSVSPLGVHLGALPAFPLLGALPANGSAPLLALPAVVAPLVAGGVGGALLIRKLPALRLEEAAGWGFCSGAVAGLGLAVLAAVSSGPVGPGRLAAVGPSAWQVGLAAALEIGLAAAVSAAVAQRRITAIV